MARILPEQARATNILIIDIERLPGLAEAWDQKTRYIPVTKFRRLPLTLCFAAKRYGRRQVEFHAAWDEAGHEAMVRRSWQLYDQADIVVTYNGVSFDNKHLRSDWQTYSLGEPRPWKDVDLFKVNLGFGRLSYGLNHLARVLGLDGKSGHYDSEMAERALTGDPRAQRYTRRYNVRDTRLTEEVYDELRGSIHNHPHLLPPPPYGLLSCNQCGSRDLEPNGEYTAQVLLYPQYRCRHCGGNVKDRKSCGRVGWSAGVR